MFALWLLPLLAWADASLDPVRHAAPLPEATRELLRWPAPAGATLSPAFAVRFTSRVRDELARFATGALAAPTCSPRGGVRFLTPGVAGTTPAEHTFEAGTFIVETVHCLDRGTAEQAAAVYQTPAFRKAVMPGLVSYWRQSQVVCLGSSGVAGLVGPTEICLDTREHRGAGTVVEHARLKSNGTHPDLQLVFHRESLIVFRDRPGGGVMVVRAVATRSQDLGSVEKALLKRVALSAAAEIGDGLAARL